MLLISYVFVVHDIIFQAENADIGHIILDLELQKLNSVWLYKRMENEQLLFQAHNCKFRRLDQSWSSIELSDPKLILNYMY